MKLIYLILKSLRFKQWVKNLFIFAPMIFALYFDRFVYVRNSVLAFFLFSLITGGIYIINDCIDRKKDRYHPIKSQRPIASGKLGVRTAIIAAIIIIIGDLFLIFRLSHDFFLIALFYIGLNLLYSLILKEIVILDVMIIAFGFVLRVMIGGVINDIKLSPWILIITFLGSLFLGLIKRRQELLKVNPAEVESHLNIRTTLKSYSIPLLDQLISITTATTLISYIMYVVNPGIQQKFHTEKLFFTIPFVVFGIFRYLYLTYIKNKGESPEDILFSDLPFTINIIIWVLVFVLLITY